jgi:hypothetical protein
MENNIKFLQKVESGVNLVVLVVGFGSRAGTDFQLTFKMLHAAFGNRAELWDHTCLVLSKCFWKQRDRWQSQVEQHVRAWQDKIRALGQYCTNDDSWNYEIPIFFIDSDPELIPTAEDERTIWDDPAVKSWWDNSQSSFSVLPFRSWKSVAIQDDRLHSIFDFMLFQEWTRTRPAMTTTILHVPSRNFFQAIPVTQTREITERVEKTEDRENEEFYFEPYERTEEITQLEDVEELQTVEDIEDNWVDEIVNEVQIMKRKRPLQVTVFVKEQKTRVVRRPKETKISRGGGCFSHGHYDTITEYINVTETYTETVPRTTSTETEVPEAVIISKTIRKNYPKKVMKSVPVMKKKETKKMVTQQVQMKCKKTTVVPMLIGFQILKFNEVRHGRRIRGWEVNAPWSEVEWDENEITKTLISEEFEPCAEIMPLRLK